MKPLTQQQGSKPPHQSRKKDAKKKLLSDEAKRNVETAELARIGSRSICDIDSNDNGCYNDVHEDYGILFDVTLLLIKICNF
jgi:hypothetical protein